MFDLIHFVASLCGDEPDPTTAPWTSSSDEDEPDEEWPKPSHRGASSKTTRGKARQKKKANQKSLSQLCAGDIVPVEVMHTSTFVEVFWQVIKNLGLYLAQEKCVLASADCYEPFSER